MPKIWFITGAGRGFGRQFATAELSRGDALLPLELDVIQISTIGGIAGLPNLG